MDRVFLDANVIFSAAHAPSSDLTRLWALPDVELISSRYALDEARRNLPAGAQPFLDFLAARLQFVEARADALASVALPEKDRPILLAAIEAGATHLLTGDLRHFGPYFGQTIDGVLIERPATYLRRRQPPVV